MRVALIHALRHSPAPIEAAFARLWPEARLMNLLDDSLSADLAAAGALDERMTERFLTLGRYAAGTGADAILFTCSAFGPCIEAVRAELAPLPVRKPNEALIAQVARIDGRIALVASFAPTLSTVLAEVPPEVEVELVYAEGALIALNEGRTDDHDRLVAEAVSKVRCDAVVLTQYSLARAADAVRAATGLTVMTTPDAAVHELKAALAVGKADGGGVVG